jgi:hypothetical protein
MWATTAMPKRRIGKAKYQNTMPPVMMTSLNERRKDSRIRGGKGSRTRPLPTSDDSNWREKSLVGALRELPLNQEHEALLFLPAQSQMMKNGCL